MLVTPDDECNMVECALLNREGQVFDSIILNVCDDVVEDAMTYFQLKGIFVNKQSWTFNVVINQIKRVCASRWN